MQRKPWKKKVMKKKWIWGKNTCFYFSNLRLGDKYINALSKSFPYSSHIKEVTISQNRLTTNGIASILLGIKSNPLLVKKINTLVFVFVLLFLYISILIFFNIF